jgi:SAM-dependent methyltransferase
MTSEPSSSPRDIMRTDHAEHEDPIAAPCFPEVVAEKYAAGVDTKPHNAYYERPAVLSLLPPIAGLKVLDAGCGNGWYAEHLVEHGATVTAVDASPGLVALTRARLGDRAEVLQVDLARPLDFAADGTFDLVLSPLVMHYLRDWEAVFTEFHRILKESGTLLFSTHHPFMDFQLFKVDSYFGTQLLEDDWRVGKVRYYRRPLTAMIDALAEAGFVVERMLEPQPTDEFRRVDPQRYERLSKDPCFLVIRARPDRR